MKKSTGMNALLIELVIVLFFFILSFSVLAQVYAHAYITENQAALQSEALFEAQNVSARLRAGTNPESVLADAGFEKTESYWQKDFEDYRMRVQCEAQEREAGVYYRMTVLAGTEEQEFFALPSSVYVGEVGL